MPAHDRIGSYFSACSNASAEEIAGHFTTDAVIYDTNVSPVRGAAEIGAFWVKVRRRWHGAVWTLDTCVAEGNHAVCEWTMIGTAAGHAFSFHGSDHYDLTSDGLIQEIRQYWTFDAEALNTGLIDYPYPRPLPPRMRVAR